MLEGLVSHHALHGAQILQSQDFQIHRNFPHKLFSGSCSDVMSWCHCSSPSAVKIGSLAIWEAASASGCFISFWGKCQMSAAQQRAVTLFKSRCLANGFWHLSATIFAFRLWLQGAPRSLRRAHVVPVSWLIAIELPRWNPHNIRFGRLRTFNNLHALHLKEFWIIYLKILKESRRSLDPNTSPWIQKHKLENQLNSAGSSVLHQRDYFGTAGPQGLAFRAILELQGGKPFN